MGTASPARSDTMGLFRNRLRAAVAVCTVLGFLILATLLAVESARAQDAPEGIQETTAETSAPERHPVVIHLPAANPVIDSGLVNLAGDPIGIACATCHALPLEEPIAAAASDLEQIHVGLELAHGDLTCRSCHDDGDHAGLRLADGRLVSFENSMRLCAQCHGPQHRDYQNGSHGGMTGHWNLSRGPRFRNHCIDCHDPHVPAYPQVLPVFAPRDRFLGDDDRGSPPNHEEMDANGS